MSGSILSDPRERAEAIVRKLNGWQLTGPGVLNPVIEFDAAVVKIDGRYAVRLTMFELPDGADTTPVETVALSLPLNVCLAKSRGRPLDVADVGMPWPPDEAERVRQELGDPAQQVDVLCSGCEFCTEAVPL